MVDIRRQPSTATTGVEELDRALNGLFWGDNVVFAADDAADVEPFYRAVAAKAALYEALGVRHARAGAGRARAAYPGLDVIDARGRASAASAAAARRDRAAAPECRGSSSCSTRSRR